MGEFTEEDEGKTVVGPAGEQIGIVAVVEHGTAYVEPDAELTDEVWSNLGTDDGDEDTFLLEMDAVDDVTESRVHLSRYPP